MNINFWTDTHAHIHDNVDEAGDIIGNARGNGVSRIVAIGIDYENSLKAIDVATSYNNIYATVGIHPEYADKYSRDNDYDKFLEIAGHKKVIAIGEIGLDFHYDDSPSVDKQNKLFQDMIDIACKVNKPITIHSRDAGMKCVNILDEAYKKYNNLRGIFHCFDGNKDVIKWVEDKDFYISYAGNVTFKNAENLREALKITPINKLLIETDSPYLAPVPKRGQKNSPANVAIIGEYIADFFKLPYPALQKQLEDNFNKLMAGLL